MAADMLSFALLHLCGRSGFPGKIKDLLAEGLLDEYTRLVLVNAIYFKGNWNKKFQESATQDVKFRINKVTLLKQHI